MGGASRRKKLGVFADTSKRNRRERKTRLRNRASRYVFENHDGMRIQ